ncbi:hypothetical protein [Xanthomonas translucens]|uniref:Uncharacterized protein n=1 Tax=Xanthomonas translucens pv. translucens TaxID=134875 RepID=A0ABW9L2M7_XANCT|nr:hypothetical protein [Xanthomonas translucens]MCT8269623.1 hypothetical protein [Xanthomonas translucens pv. undulosa]MCT8282125.1 hypothetical protein [Xanthomonas translucens pv. undulosa]MCT8316904.1 hypothetical protein [Xanthomonas translucens pv. undulosa]WNJ30324.1 hypothetical protein RMA82_16455 [Xanthomonas translucens pv. undulosa]
MNEVLRGFYVPTITFCGIAQADAHAMTGLRAVRPGGDRGARVP